MKTKHPALKEKPLEFSRKINVNKENRRNFGSPKSLQMVISAMKLKDAYSLEENYDQPRKHIEKQRHYFANKGPSSQGYGFSCGHVWM